MKANEAPEKIYISTNSQDGTYYISNQYKRLVEYTRTDALLEKACEYLQINLWRVVNEEPDFRQRFVTDFKNYIKGE